MQLLYQREQVRNSWGYIRFKLWAKVELEEEERKLINKYSMNEAILINVPQPGLMRQAFLVGILVFILIFCFFFFGIHYQMQIYVRVYPVMNALWSLAGAIVISMIYYHNKRETIYVKDLIHGRYFKCKSIISLARREAYLQSVTAYFRQVLESAKNWGGTEKFPIEPLPPEEAKRTILSGPFLD